MTEFFLEKTFEEILALHLDVKDELGKIEKMSEQVESIHQSIQNISREQIKKQDEILNALNAIYQLLAHIHRDIRALNQNK